MTLRFAPAAAVHALDMKDFDPLDLLHRPDALANDPLETIEKLAAQPAGAGLVGQQILRLIELALSRSVDLIALGGGEGADFFGLGRGGSGDRLRFCEAACGAHFGVGRGRDAKRLAFSLALRGDKIGELPTLRYLALTGGQGLLLGLNRPCPRRLRCGDGGGALLRLCGDLDRLLDFGDLDPEVAVDCELREDRVP